MKSWSRLVTAVFVCLLFWGLGFPDMKVCAAEETVKQGVYAESLDLSGMTGAEALSSVAGYVESLKEVPVTLIAGGGNEVVTTAGALGLAWSNPDLVEEALELGTAGNVIERYKVIKDLEHENIVYDIELSFDISAINDLLAGECSRYDQKAVNASLKRENGTFQIVQGQTGYKLDVESSIDNVYDYLTGEWTGEPVSINLNITVEEPRGNEGDLALVQDVLGTFTTSFSTSGKSRTANVTNGCKLVDGTTVYPGEEFSFYEAVAPFSQNNGYYMAASYLNGKVVDSIGGGICQVSTTLYNTVLKAELEVTERHNHSMIVTYVDPSADAAIAESSGKDFKFINNTDAPIYIEGIIQNKKITFNIYGKETRPANRKVSYVSEILETIQPTSDQIYQDAGQPIGYFVNGESVHIGYKARLWKVVTVDGKEVSREQVNKSSYKMTPRSATVGVGTSDPNAYNEIQAAIGTGSIDHVKNVIAILTGQAATAQSSGEVINEAPAE